MFLAVTTSDTQITNLLHLYAELMDAGRLEECCDLFADARVVLDAEADPPEVVDRDGLMQVWRSLPRPVRMHRRHLAVCREDLPG